MCPLFVRFLLESHKNEKYESCFLDVARPLDAAQRGAYHAIVVSRELFGRIGFVLPHIDSSGVVDTARPMSYGNYVRHLRHALVNLGMGQSVAQTFAGQSPRAGAGTEAARARVRPEMVVHAAGVKSTDWILTYNRADIGDRLQASWSLGL